MEIIGIEYIGFFVRFCYIKIFKDKAVKYKELWKKTEYNKRFDYLKISNHNLGIIVSFFLMGILSILLR